MSGNDRYHEVEFRLSNELYEDALWVAGQHYLNLREFAVASVGLLNAAHRKNFQTNATVLLVGQFREELLPSLLDEAEEELPRSFRTELSPPLYNPMVEYQRKRGVTIDERARRSIRFGVFALTHAMPNEGDLIMFRHRGTNVGLPFRTKQ